MKEGFAPKQEDFDKAEEIMSPEQKAESIEREKRLKEEKKILELTNIMNNLQPNFSSEEAGENLFAIEELDNKLYKIGSKIMDYELSKTLYNGQFIQPRYKAFDTENGDIEKMILRFKNQHEKYVESKDHIPNNKLPAAIDELIKKMGYSQ